MTDSSSSSRCTCLHLRSSATKDTSCKMVRLRVSAKSELIGLDMSQHSEVYGLDALGQHTELDEEVPTEQEWNTSIGEN